MASPTVDHQETVINILELLRVYQRATRRGRALTAPLDVLVSRNPLRTRQPDVLFISRERLEEAGGRFLEGPLTTAPELAVEVLSGSDTRRARADKIADYAAIGVTEGSDAISVVVSEETGLITFVENGVVRRNLDTNQLRKLLLEAMSIPVAQRKREPTKTMKTDETEITVG